MENTTVKLGRGICGVYKKPRPVIEKMEFTLTIHDTTSDEITGWVTKENYYIYFPEDQV